MGNRMKARFVNEQNFKRNKDPLSSMGIGPLERIRKDWSKEYPSSEHNPTNRDLLVFCIEYDKWDDVKRLAAMPNKVFKKATFKTSINVLMDYPNKHSEEELIERIDFLLENGANPASHQWGAFKRSCSRGLPLVVERFIELGADPNDGTDIPIRNTVGSLESIHTSHYSYSASDFKRYWDVIRVLVKYSKY